jgi:hypothetical protein
VKASLNRSQLADIRGTARMLVDASAGIVDIVERMHRTIQVVPWPFGQPVHSATRGLTGQIYRGIRGGMRLAGRGLDASLGSVEALLPERSASPEREAFASLVNGICGDHLARTGNPLAIEMRLRHGGARHSISRDRGSGRQGVLAESCWCWSTGCACPTGNGRRMGAVTAPRWPRSSVTSRCTCATTAGCRSRRTAGNSRRSSNSSSVDGRTRSTSS